MAGSDLGGEGRGEQPLHAAARARAGEEPAAEYRSPYPPYPYDMPDESRLEPKLAAGLAYTVVGAVFFLLLEPYKSSRLVRFHSWQAIFLFVGLAAARIMEQMLAAMLPSFAAFSVGSLLFLVLLVAWVVGAIKAMQGSEFQLPLVGAMAASTAASSRDRR